MRKYLLLGGCLLLLYAHARPQPPVRQLQAALEAFSRGPQLRYASYAFCLLDARTGQTLFARNEHVGLAPASCLKTVTAATALQLLGPRYQYTTQLAYSGSIGPGGVLQGDVLIHGGGDPSLGSPRYRAAASDAVLQHWVQAIQQAGIRKITGRIIGDDRCFDTQTLPDGWIWQDIGNYYGAGASGLSWRENQFDILLRPGARPGQPVTVTGTRPAMPYLTLVNELTTGPAGSGDQAYVYLPPYSRLAYLRGSAGPGQPLTIAAALPDPAYECAYRLQESLQAAGITAGSVTTARILQQEGQPAPAAGTPLHTHASPALEQLVHWFLKKSVNLYGEHLVKTLARQAGGPVSTAAGIRVLRRYWQQQGIDSNAVNVIDGSGLSPANRITAAALARVLYLARQQSWFSAYYEALPEINGLKMKDGYIANVRSYAGYVTPAQGPPLVFAFIVNNFSGSPGSIRQQMWTVLDQLRITN